MENLNLYLMVDTSGSMAEGGKSLIARGFVRAVEQMIRLGYFHGCLKLVALNENPHFVDWNTNEEYPKEMLDCHGSFDCQAMKALVPNGTESKVLILSDGNWNSKTYRFVQRWMEDLPPDTIRFVKIGADAGFFFPGCRPFLTEDLFSVLDGWRGGEQI